MASVQLRHGLFSIARYKSFAFPSNDRNRRVTARAEEKDGSYQNKLRLYIDSANAEDWKKWLTTGVFHGLSTSPVQLQNANIACHPKRLAILAAEASKMGAEEVQMQAWGKTVDSYVSVGSDLARISSSVVVKVPATPKGVEAAAKLVKQGVRVNLVGIYSLSQVLLAVATGVEYASTRLNRLCEIGKSTQDIKKMQATIKCLGGTLKLLVEEMNNLDEVVDLTSSGIGTLSLSIPLIEQLFGDVYTEQETAEQESAALKNPYRLFF